MGHDPFLVNRILNKDPQRVGRSTDRRDVESHRNPDGDARVGDRVHVAAAGA